MTSASIYKDKFFQLQGPKRQQPAHLNQTAVKEQPLQYIKKKINVKIVALWKYSNYLFSVSFHLAQMPTFPVVPFVILLYCWMWHFDYELKRELSLNCDIEMSVSVLCCKINESMERRTAQYHSTWDCVSWEKNLDSRERCRVCAMKRHLLTVVPVPQPMVIYCTSSSSCYWLCLKTKHPCFYWTCHKQEILVQTGWASAVISFTCIILTLAFWQWHLTAMLDLLYW